MAQHCPLTSLMSLAMLLNAAFCANFSDFFQPLWAPDHIATEGDHINLSLDTVSGNVWFSYNLDDFYLYLFGKASMQIKLVEGDSAGTVTAFYMSSEGPNRDELDFEYLGNVSGEPYLVQTNVYVNGSGNREQRHSLWFDPTLDFHTYSLFWNRRYIVFLVNGIPIRVFANKEENGGIYPKSQAMSIRGSMWNADDWATQGGRVKTNWSHSPFVATFRSFEIDACELSPETDDVEAECAVSRHFWWDKPSVRELNRHQSHQLKWVRRKHMVYDYCKDVARFTELPRECIN
ncbi:hypothetical protein Pint_16758 [Pistacia integerrima]|uniref:Uncharacterized protein n=1 Tax=Pistacia integerrima TaxID=434235 RepID=A0ACC0ZD35_9ROSI|nr:hypothetical protein Pint_16758 [Pistacia integerrima]